MSTENTRKKMNMWWWWWFWTHPSSFTVVFHHTWWMGISWGVLFLPTTINMATPPITTSTSRLLRQSHITISSIFSASWRKIIFPVTEPGEIDTWWTVTRAGIRGGFPSCVFSIHLGTILTPPTNYSHFSFSLMSSGTKFWSTHFDVGESSRPKTYPAIKSFELCKVVSSCKIIF